MGAMSLGFVQDGLEILIDSDILLYWLHGHSRQCRDFVERCVLGEVRGHVSAICMAEVFHRLMLAEAKRNGWLKRPNPTGALRARPERVRALIDSDERCRDLLKLGLVYVDLQTLDLLQSLAVRRRYGLLTNDSILVAIAMRLGISRIASADRDLRKIQELTVYVPDDLPSS